MSCFHLFQEKFLEIAPHVKRGLIDSIGRLGKGGLDVLNLVIPKPNIPPDIANNYKQVTREWVSRTQLKREITPVKNISSSVFIN